MARRNEYFSPKLYHAVDNNDCDTLKELLSQGANPDQFYEDMTNVSSKNLLHIASEKSRIDCVKVLLDAGANVRIRDDWGLHPMMYTLISRHYETAKILLSHDPYLVNIQDRYGKAPIHIAIESDCVESVRLLLDHGCNVDCYNSNGITPLMTLCTESDLENRLAMMDILLAKRPYIEKMDFRSRRTALQHAVIKTNIEAVEVLLQVGADPNTVDLAGRTPITNVMWENVKIYHAKKGIDPEVMTIILMLIEHGADLNFNKVEYGNPLVTAAFLEAEPLIKFLLESGCNPNVTFESGVTPLLVSVIKKDIVSAKALVQWSCKMDIKGHVFRKGEDIFVDAFELAVDNASWDIVQLLVNAGYDLNKHEYVMNNEYNGKTPETFQKAPDMLIWLRQQALTPMCLCHMVLLKLWKMLKTDIQSKIEHLFLPNKIKQTIKNGDFLILSYVK